MSDKGLIERAQGGDSNAFEALLETHYETIYTFAYRWCGRQDDAEDITQIVCVKLARAIAQFRFESSFTSWLYRLVINAAKDWQKAQARHASSSDSTTELHDIPATPSAPENAVFLQQLMTRMNTLPDGFKETMLLVHAEGMNHREAAAILDIKESTISWRIHEARKQLKAMFTPEESKLGEV